MLAQGDWGLVACAGNDRASAGLLVGGHVADVASLVGRVEGRASAGPLRVDDVLAAWAEWLPVLTGAATRVLEAGVEAPTWDDLFVPLGKLTLRPPVCPGQVLQSGANYRKHVAQLLVAQRSVAAPNRSRDEIERDAYRAMDERAATGVPYMFLGAASAMCGPFDDVVLPAAGRQHDWEVELAAVIGRPARHVDRRDAYAHVAGYTIVNDITTRDLVFRPDVPGIGTDWLRSKNAPTFLPTGPALVPSSCVGDPMDLWITLRLNGQVMQDETTADMVFDVARLVEYTSSIVELRPGDLLLTGSPAGNGAHWDRFLQPGDVMEAEITGLGMQRNRCVAEETGG